MPENRQNRSVLNSAICPEGVVLAAFYAEAHLQAVRASVGAGRSEY
jgi:hypothetical protein